MAGKKSQEQIAQEEMRRVRETLMSLTWTQAEVMEREDLVQKLLTLDHVKSILVSTGDSKVYIDQIEAMREMVENWMKEQVQRKIQLSQNEPAGGEGQAPQDAEEDDEER